MKAVSAYWLTLCLIAPFAYCLELGDEPLIVGTEHYPPYEMERPVNNLRGFDYEVLQRVAEVMGLNLEIKFYPWKRAINYAKSGQILGILTCAHQEEREKFITFSDPISEFDDGYYYRHTFRPKEITTLADFIGTRVGSVDGYESYKALQKAGAKPIAANTTELAIKMLINERFDYLHLGKQATDFIIKNQGLSQAFRFVTLERQSFYFCFSKRHPMTPTLHEPFNKALQQVKDSGDYQLIHDKYR